MKTEGILNFEGRRYLTVAAAAEKSQRSIATIYRALDGNKLAGLLLFGHKLVDENSLIKWMQPRPIGPRGDRHR